MAYRRVPGALESSRDLTIFTFPPLPPVEETAYAFPGAEGGGMNTTGGERFYLCGKQ